VIGNRTHNLVITSDGKKALVYNMAAVFVGHVVGPGQGRLRAQGRAAGLRHHADQHYQHFLGIMLNGTMATVAMKGPHPASPGRRLLQRHRRPIFDYLHPGCQDRQGDLVEL